MKGQTDRGEERMNETREEFVRLVNDCYNSGKISSELVRDLVGEVPPPSRVYLTAEEFEKITGQKY